MGRLVSVHRRGVLGALVSRAQGYGDAVATKSVTDADRRLVEWLAGREFGSIRVTDVDARRVSDSEGDVALRLTLIAPLDGRETWDLKDIHDLEFAVREKALELGVDWPWQVELRPDVDEPQEEDAEPEPPIGE